MRNILLSVIALVSIIFYFISCKKETSGSNGSANKEQITKVTAWLDNQKMVAYPLMSNGIEVLKEHLDFQNLHYEASDRQEQILVIPITDEYKTIKQLKANAIPELVLILNPSGAIRKGDLVIYTPDKGSSLAKLPDNTFYNLYNTAKLDCSGQFLFLSPWGKWRYQLQYTDGKLSFFGLINKQNDPNSITAGRTEECINWYLTTTYYWNDGTTTQTTEFVGRTCDGCDGGDTQGFCPNTNSSGGDQDIFEFEVIRNSVTWNVADNLFNSMGQIVSIETIKGKRSSVDPNGGYFTSISHNSSSCNFCNIDHPDDVWEETLSEVSTAAQSVSSHVAGHLQYSGNGANVNNTKTWTPFNSVF